MDAKSSDVSFGFCVSRSMIRFARYGSIHSPSMRGSEVTLLLAVTMKWSGGSKTCGSSSNGIQPVHSPFRRIG